MLYFPSCFAFTGCVSRWSNEAAFHGDWELSMFRIGFYLKLNLKLLYP